MSWLKPRPTKTFELRHRLFRPEELAQNAFRLYEKFRPAIPEDVTGWGAKGRLEIERIRSLGPEK
jgi:hypothetical protein